MFVQAQLRIDTFVFHSDIFSPQGIIQEQVRIFDRKVRIFDRKVRIAKYENQHGQLVLPPPISAGSPSGNIRGIREQIPRMFPLGI